MNDIDRATQRIKESTANPKYRPGHTIHTEDCMSEWGESRRGLPMDAQTIEQNHRLHMADVADAEAAERRQIRGYTVHEFERSEFDNDLCAECGNSRSGTMHK